MVILRQTRRCLESVYLYINRWISRTTAEGSRQVGRAALSPALLLAWNCRQCQSRPSASVYRLQSRFLYVSSAGHAGNFRLHIACMGQRGSPMDLPSLPFQTGSHAGLSRGLLFDLTRHGPGPSHAPVRRPSTAPAFSGRSGWEVLPPLDRFCTISYLHYNDTILPFIPLLWPLEGPFSRRNAFCAPARLKPTKEENL